MVNTNAAKHPLVDYSSSSSPEPRPKRQKLDSSCLTHVYLKSVRQNDDFINKAFRYLEERTAELEGEVKTLKREKWELEGKLKDEEKAKNALEERTNVVEAGALRRENSNLICKIMELKKQRDLAEMPKDPEAEMDKYFGYNKETGRCGLN
jgi:chromosome segregation ATPase